jgi:hypothetical protein
MYKRDKKGRFKKGTPQPFGFGKGKQKVPWNYKGGSLDHNGYRIVYVNGKREYENKYIWEKHNGKVPEGYVVHHINFDILDNRLENLMCMSRTEHNKIHKKGGNLGRK